jgi:hypothetical protein
VCVCEFTYARTGEKRQKALLLLNVTLLEDSYMVNDDTCQIAANEAEA